MRSSSRFVDHDSCKECGSTNNLAWFDDGHAYCFGCKHYIPGDGTSPKKEREARKVSNGKTPTPLFETFRPLVKRCVPEDAVRKYGIGVNQDRDKDVSHYYPYFKDGVHVDNKVRKRSEKSFYWETGEGSNAELFGQHLFPAGSARAITVVEGELDAPSAWTLTGSRYPCVSVTNAATALKDCQRNYEYLNSFEEIVLCFDKDEAKTRPNGEVFHPGQDAAKKVAELFAPGKCRILTLERGKDPNDYRVQGIEPKIFVNEWYRAPKFSPDGLIIGTDMWEKIINRPQHFQIPYPIDGMNDKTYGVRLSELVIINAPTGIGKTSLLKKIEYGLLTNPEVVEKGYGVGFLHLEELDTDLALGLMSIHNSKPYHLPDVPRTQDELKEAYDAVINTPRVVIYDHFGSNEIEAILSKVRHMVALGCKYIVLDHLSIVVSDQNGDERKQLDEITTKLKTLCMEANIALIAVIHQNRNGQIRGTAGVEQLANIIFRLERDLLDPDPWRRNVLKIYTEKNRFCGRTGPTAYLFYDEMTGQLIELDQDAVSRYDQGGSINDADIPF